VQYSNLKQVLKGRLARFSSSTSLDQYIVAELNAMMNSLEEEAFIPWFLWKDAIVIAFIDSYKAPLPADFARARLTSSEDPKENFAKIEVDNRYQPLTLMEKNPLNEGVVTLTPSNQTRPAKYFIDHVNREICFDSYSDAEYNVLLSYVRTGDRYATTPGDTDEVLWAKHVPEYLIAAAGMRIASMYIKNAEASQVFFADVQRERTKLIHKHTAIIESSFNPNSEN
jgi:hypothetical protein